MSSRRSQHSSSYPSSHANHRRRHGHADEDEIDPLSSNAYAGYQHNASSHRFSSDGSGYHPFASEDVSVPSMRSVHGPPGRHQSFFSGPHQGGSTQPVFRYPQYQTLQSQSPNLASDFCHPNPSAAGFPGTNQQQPQQRWIPSYPPAVDSSSGHGNAFARQGRTISGPQHQDQRGRRLSTQARNGSWDEQQSRHIDPRTHNARLDEEDGSDTSEDTRQSIRTQYVEGYMDRDDHPWCPWSRGT
ncbi:hypothetical protein GGR57DRAFT_504703 [Xylariaceae sp. FL1272]|nr:hypothetical protein GGR57DRAFT_504703 [Xylariaceae sp. FL1272]